MNSSKTNNTKDTIYIDVDDEITSIIDKVKNSESKIVALVLPKRAVVLQSIVNMKLLKRASDSVNKRTVLITSEQGLLPLAGVVGVYVAKNLQSKPEIPSAPDGPELDEELVETEDAADDLAIDTSTAIGDLADDSEAVFETDTTSVKEKAAFKAVPKKVKSSKLKSGKKNKVPNFDSFRKKIAIGSVVVIGLLILAYVAFFVAPRAVLAIKIANATTNKTINFTASPSAQSLDLNKSIVPAKQAELTKTENQKVPTTGQKDLGSKASGTVTLSINCANGTPTIPAGTGVSSGSLTFITTQTVTVASFPVGSCKFQKDVGVIAQANGDQYNLGSGKSFTVAGFSSVSAKNDDAFSGGATKMAKVVSQQDIDTAKQKLADNSESVKGELKKQLEDGGYFALVDSFTTKSDKITVSPEVDAEATEVSVTAERIYTMTGVKQDNLEKLITQSLEQELKDRSLQVHKIGLDEAVFRMGDRGSNGSVAVSMQAQIELGPKIDESQLKRDVAGKKRGDVAEMVKSIEGVNGVEVKFSPFWVNVVPKNIDKITVKYEEANN